MNDSESTPSLHSMLPDVNFFLLLPSFAIIQFEQWEKIETKNFAETRQSIY